MIDNEIVQQYRKYEPIFGNWYIKRFIGEGGFAKVFEIVRNEFGREYVSALKIITVSKTKSEINTLKSEGMTNDDIKAYLRSIVEDTVSEIQLMYKLRGKGNIVSYEDHAVVEHEDGRGWDILIKMEYLTSLSTYIRRQKGRILKRDIIMLGVDICKSLEACQRYNIIHRDIKADNIFIADDGEFKLGDFGIARVMDRKDQTMSKKGTSAYMAPEVYKGQTYTSAVDIYSLGMVMYRLMNNNRGPFLPPYPRQMSLDDRDKAMMMRMSGEKFPKPNQVTGGRLVEIVLKACAYRPEERYSGPGYMRQELEAILLDRDGMTTEEWIMIYDAQGRSTASNSSLSQSGISAPESPEPTQPTEVLREEGATEVLRKDATEVLHDEAALDSAQSMFSSIRKPCIKCGSSIEYNAIFCSFCGANQEEPKQRVESEQRVELEQRIEPEQPNEQELIKEQELPKESKEAEGRKHISDKLKSIWNTRKLLVIGGACAAVLLLAVIIGVTSAGPTNPQRPWLNNVLMYGFGSSTEIATTYAFGSKIYKTDIITITFLDSLDTMPADAWDVSLEKNKGVMAWTVSRNDRGYDLYIGAEGGVTAPSNAANLFSEFYNVKQIDFNGSFHTDNTTDMSSMFLNCMGLENVDLSELIISDITSMASMFSGCKTLTSLDLSGFDTSKVTSMNAMFVNCIGLTNLDLKGFDTSEVTDMGNMFEGCRKLTSLDLSGFDTSKVTDMGGMFYNCSSLKDLYVGDDFDNFSGGEYFPYVPEGVTIHQSSSNTTTPDRPDQ